MAGVVEIGPQTLDDFYKITGEDVRNYLINYAVFYQSDYQSIKNFFTGKSKTVEQSSFENLKKIQKELHNVLDKFNQFGNQLENIRFVELLEIIEETQYVLKSLYNINKWARVTTDTFGYNPNFKVAYVLSQFDSLEKISSSVIRSDNPQDDWRQIAIDNLLTEDEYTSKGGKLLNVSLTNRGIKNFNINSVVDIINGDSIKGRDINKHISFDGDDLSILNESDTITQSVDILIKLKKKDNLDFLDQGLQTTLIIGQSRNIFNFPIVDRQLKEVFKTDDTLKEFTITRYYFEQDNVFIEFNVKTRVGETIELAKQLNGN